VNALDALIADYATRRLAGAGKVTAVSLGAEDITATVELLGQTDPVSFRAEGLRWATNGAEFQLSFASAHCTLPWMNALLQAWATSQGRKVSFRDDLKFLPLKLRLRRAD
jgi:hypothetical protein